ncbi:MAG: MBL fold metallo-hydrolase [Mucispirillum sp.]|nr:MBL fold metallo-hydrolase [Mucispirillum sp.]
MQIERLTLKLLAENCYIYHNDKECIVFDPGSDFEHIKSFIEKKNLSVNQILLTHCHFDHVGAVSDLKDYFNTKVMCHKDDIEMLNSANKSAANYGLMPVKIPEIDGFLNDNDIICFNNADIKVIHTPGHSAGSVCFYVEEDKFLVSGDTLFLESVGRTDFPSGSQSDLDNSILNKLYILPDDTMVLPGHGFHTTIKHEKEYNPFIHV